MYAVEIRAFGVTFVKFSITYVQGETRKKFPSAIFVYVKLGLLRHLLNSFKNILTLLFLPEHHMCVSIHL